MTSCTASHRLEHELQENCAFRVLGQATSSFPEQSLASHFGQTQNFGLVCRVQVFFALQKIRVDALKHHAKSAFVFLEECGEVLKTLPTNWADLLVLSDELLQAKYDFILECYLFRLLDEGKERFQHLFEGGEVQRVVRPLDDESYQIPALCDAEGLLGSVLVRFLLVALLLKENTLNHGLHHVADVGGELRCIVFAEV